MTAIYARQSVERPDSISIEMQISKCMRQLEPEAEPMVYVDRGFSGTNTKRPGFQKLLEAVKHGEIREVFVYKLDRISRSLCDFAGMMAIFRTHQVTLHSVQEQFDTESEMGKMLLHLLIMFAELEQRTIAGRVRDNYYARAAEQLALGGTAPYGYQAEPLLLDGKKTTALRPIPAEAAQVAAFYTGYGIRHLSVEQIVQQANREGISTRSGACWSNSTVARILRSPVYVQGDWQCVRFLQQQGVTLDHEPALYCQGNGYLCYGSNAGQKREISSWCAGKHLAAGLHPGIVEPALWLQVQKRLQSRHQGKNRGSGHTSWLQGLVVCGNCGQRCYTRNNGAGAQYTYWVCRGKRLGLCAGISGLRAEAVERAVLPVLTRRAALVLPYAQCQAPSAPLSDTLALEALEGKLERAAAACTEPSAPLPYLRREMNRLIREKQQLEAHLRLEELQAPQEQQDGALWESWWKNATLEERRCAAELLLKEVQVFPEKIVVELA